MKTFSRVSPISSSSWFSSWPARPTKGSPWRSSSAPGASPTNISSASALPAPKTVLARVSCRGHLVQVGDLAVERDQLLAALLGARRSRLLPRSPPLPRLGDPVRARRFAIAAPRFVGAHRGTAGLAPRRRDVRDQPPRPRRAAGRTGRRARARGDQLLEASPALLALELVDRHRAPIFVHRGDPRRYSAFGRSGFSNTVLKATTGKPISSVPPRRSALAVWISKIRSSVDLCSSCSSFQPSSSTRIGTLLT